MNSTASSILTDIKSSGPQCDKDALTDFFGWMLQGVLAGLAFTCLIGTCVIDVIHLFKKTCVNSKRLN